MITQSATVNRRLSNVITVGVVFTILSVIAGTFWIMFSYRQVLDMRAEYHNLKYSTGKLRSGHATVQQPQLPQSALAAMPTKEQRDTTIATPPVVHNNDELAITTEIKPVISNKQDGPPTLNKKDIIVSYYFRTADNESLQIALKSLGYNFYAKKSDKNTGYEKSNCIWFGKGVPLTDVKRVAIAMIQSGNTIKGIKRFPRSYRASAYKHNIIEVGMDVKLNNFYANPLSIVEIERAKDFR